MEFLGDYILLSTVYPPGNTIADRSRMISDASLGKAANQPSSLSYMLLLLGSNNSDIAATFVFEEGTEEAEDEGLKAVFLLSMHTREQGSSHTGLKMSYLV